MMRPLVASFFTVAAGEYEKLNFTAQDASVATLFIYGACLGVVLAALYAFYQQKVPGGVVRALLRAEALCPESAKTADELGLSSHPIALWELTRGTTLRRVVHIVKEEEPRYYIPHEDKYRAEIRFDKKGNGLAGLLITVALSLVLALALIKLLPIILNIIDGFMR